MVITSDFDSDNLSSILSGTFLEIISNSRAYYCAKLDFILIIIKLLRIVEGYWKGSLV